MRGNCVALAVVLAAAALGAAGPASAACKFQKITDVPVTMDGLRPHVSAKVNGHETTFLVDTGAFFSTVSDDAVTRFGMKRSTAPFGLMVKAVGGAVRDARAVSADNFSFAGAGFHNIQFLTGGRVGNASVAGLIGENIMGPFDVEYDFANGVIRFFKADGCSSANLAYWSAGMAVSRISLDAPPGPILQSVNTTAQVDGRNIRVTLDTGSPVSMLSRNAAARAGVQISSEGVASAGVTYGIYGKGQELFLAPFASFKIGDEEIKNTKLRVGDLNFGESDMLLGADFFLSHRVLISASQKKLYFTYNGGPVFRLDRAASQQQAQANSEAAPAATASAAPDAAPAGADTPKTAADFQRRGQALAARRDFPAAIEDFTKAIELEPKDGAHYHSRAMARLAARQPVLAMADLDAALKYQPDDVPALMARGELYLQTRDTGRAAADFDKAMQLAPENTALPVQIGTYYARAGQFEPAIQHFDSWVAAHPKAMDLPQVLSARCWTRAMWGHELEKALADCDQALRGDRISSVMENRGLVLLRLGRTDDAIAQYAAAIRLQPRAAPALYGRGLAELKKGDKSAGEADIAAAKAIAPGLAAEYKRYGLAPDEPAAAGGKS